MSKEPAVSAERLTPRLRGWSNMLPALSLPPYSHATKRYPRRQLQDIRYAIIHHTGSNWYRDGNAYRHFLAAAAYHVRLGWPGVGYHYGVDERGVAYWLGSAASIRWHAGSWIHNEKGIGIVLPGNFEWRYPTHAQVAGIEKLLLRLDDIVSNEAGYRIKLRIEPHSAVRIGGTECPGDHVRRWIEHLRNR